ncbi:glutamate receptor 1-like isoform X2 [Palaemon carinicauda]|uniref:glutamate receptor 1-like isoform X2 n=1 Tax=Palaemon carinicauda TaxID=392227 RepID=UPI0035B577FE
MKEASVKFWTILTLLSRAFSLRGEIEVLSAAQNAASAVLGASSCPGCSVVYVTDGTASSTSLYQMIGSVETDSSIAVFEVAWKDRNTTSGPRLEVPLDLINKVRKTSSYTTLVLLSNERDFLIDFIEEAVRNDILIWPTRLLVVTSVSIVVLQLLRKSLSDTNAMVVFEERASQVERCGVFMYLPYSHRMVKIASWTLESGLVYYENLQPFPDKFQRLEDGANLKVVGQNFPPHVVVRELTLAGQQEKEEVFTGPLLNLLEMLALNVNFTYNLLQPSDGSWGFLFPNGTWNGMVGMLLRKDVDFALGPFGITYLRAQVIDYTSPLVVDYGRILGRRGDTAVDPWSFALPLTYTVWAGVFASLLLVLIFAVWMEKFKLSSDPSSVGISPESYVRTIFMQDVKTNSGSNGQRVMFAAWLAFVLIVFECYSSNLMSLLAVRHISEPYQSVRQMLDDPKVTSIWFANTAYMQYLSAVDSGIFYEVVQMGKKGRMKQITPSVYAETVDDLVSRGDHVMINPFLIMKMFLTEDYMDEGGNCKFYVSKERFLPLTFCMVVPKYSPLLGPINEGIRAVVEGGIYNYWLDNAFANAKSCKNPPSKITVRSSLSLANVWVSLGLGMFVLLASGFGISFLTFCLEIISAKYYSFL